MCRFLIRKYKCCIKRREVGILPCEWSHRTQPWTPCPRPHAEVRWDPHTKYCDDHVGRETKFEMRAQIRAKTMAEIRRLRAAEERRKVGNKGDGIKKPRRSRKSKATDAQEAIEV